MTKSLQNTFHVHLSFCWKVAFDGGSLFSTQHLQILNDFRRNKKNHLCFRLLVTKLFSMLSYFCLLWQSEQCLIHCFWAFTTCINSTMWCDFQMKHFLKIHSELNVSLSWIVKVWSTPLLKHQLRPLFNWDVEVEGQVHSQEHLHKSQLWCLLP